MQKGSVRWYFHFTGFILLQFHFNSISSLAAPFCHISLFLFASSLNGLICYRNLLWQLAQFLVLKRMFRAVPMLMAKSNRCSISLRFVIIGNDLFKEFGMCFMREWYLRWFKSRTWFMLCFSLKPIILWKFNKLYLDIQNNSRINMQPSRLLILNMVSHQNP